jgi:hypothetical protein
MGGALGMDFGLEKIPVVGNFFKNPNEQHMQDQFAQAANAYGAYRPEAAQARMNALGQQQSAFRPMNAAMGQMYGPGAQQDTTDMLKNPMSERMMNMGNTGKGTTDVPEPAAPAKAKKKGK